MWSELGGMLLMVTGAFCFVNLVHDDGLSGKATMGANPQESGWSADKAIDGNTNQTYVSFFCAITDFERNRNATIWWKVWLSRQFNVTYLEIYFRSDTFKRSSGFSIYTSDAENSILPLNSENLIYRHELIADCNSPVQNITVNNVTQGIIFFNERYPGYQPHCEGDSINVTAIELCEVKVMGCDIHKFSSNCDILCSTRCKNRLCDVFNGSCIYGCSDPSITTFDCRRPFTIISVCSHGTYLVNRQCVPCQGHCKENTVCNNITGRCDYACSNHWTGEFCNVATQESKENNESITPGDGSSNIACYAVIAGLVIIQAITVSIVVYQRRRMSDLLRIKHPTEDVKSQRQTTTTNYDNLAFAAESHEYVSMDSTKRD